LLHGFINRYTINNGRKPAMIAYKWFEKGITFVLIIMMSVVLLLSTADLAVTLFNDIVTPPIILDINELLDIFGLFMIVLIGIELLATIKAYMDEHVVHIEIVLEVAMIAIARKVIILDIKKEDSLTLFGIAAIILALAVSYYLFKLTFRSHSHQPTTLPDGRTGSAGDIQPPSGA
jgi:uncharacterized membrane protein (DUF373 family)